MVFTGCSRRFHSPPEQQMRAPQHAIQPRTTARHPERSEGSLYLLNAELILDRSIRIADSVMVYSIERSESASGCHSEGNLRLSLLFPVLYTICKSALISPDQAPATVMPSTRIVGAALAPRKTRSFAMAEILRYISFKFPAIVISSTGYASSPFSIHKPLAPCE